MKERPTISIQRSALEECPARIFLTGYRGTGKTTVARCLAQQLGWDSVDTDDLVEKHAGRMIAEIFADGGEQVFRDLEEQLVADACQLKQTIIALGGGAVLRESTRQRLTASGPVVWLTAPAEVLAERLGADETTAARRPNLTARGGLEEIRQVLAERTPVYHNAATCEISTMDRSPDEIAKLILVQLGIIAED